MMSDQNTHMDKKLLQKRYKEAVQYLDDNYAYFLTHVLKIGKPEWTAAMDTAAVMLDLQDQNSFLPGGKTDDLDYDEFKFVFNPQFAAQLDNEQLAFVMAHETMHILLNHLKLANNFVDTKKLLDVNRKQEKGKRLTKDEIKEALIQNQNAMRFNIAADCVINDYLANAGFHIWHQAMRGYTTVGTDCANLTVTEVYELLEKQGKMQTPPQCPTCGGSGQKPKDDEKDGKKDKGESGKGDKNEKADEKPQDGSGGQDDQEGQDGEDQGQGGGHSHSEDAAEPCPDCGGSGKGQPGQGAGGGVGADYVQMDNHGWMLDPEWADKMADAIDKLNDEVEQQTGLPGDLEDKKAEEDGQQSARQQQLANSMRPGTEDGNMKEFIEQSGANLAWAKLLKDIDPNMFKEPGVAPPLLPSFRSRRRKLGAPQFKKTALPVYEREHRIERETNQKPAIVLALDVSGSIGPRDAERFVTLAKSIPFERIKLFCCTFEYNYRPIDPQTVTHISSGGGTNFDAIPNFINDHVKPELKGAYPKAVVVITDGQAQLSRHLWPTDEEAESWLWLISPQDRARGTYRASLDIGRRTRLDDYIA
jgi:predicted metal-dependent peptidase